MLIATFGGRAALHLAQSEYGARVARAAKLLKHWLPVLGWMLLIAIASTDLMSAEHTSRLIRPFLRLCFPDISPATVATVQIGLRKAAHLAEYAVLALLLRRALVLPAGEFNGGWRLESWWCASATRLWTNFTSHSSPHGPAQPRTC